MSVRMRTFGTESPSCVRDFLYRKSEVSMWGPGEGTD
jgi:hypothetical protein